MSTIEVESEPTVLKLSAHSLAIKASNQLRQFDINEKLVGSPLDYSFYEVEGSKIIGWKMSGSSLAQTWTFTLPSDHQLLQVSSAYNGESQSLLPIANDRRVILKNVDFSNLAVLSLQEGKVAKLHLFLLNGRTGHVEFN